MPCYHPKYIYKDPKTGKLNFNMRYGTIPVDKDNKDFVLIPCNRCIGCRLDYSRQWADRCYLEAQQHKHNFMITLTYDDETVPTKRIYNKQTGEVETVQTLNPDDFTKFVKDLRRYYEYHYKLQDIRIFGAGEYGDQTQRPHYHIIFFNLPITDLKQYKKNELGQMTYTSDIINKIWKKGITNIAKVTWNTCAYVARYVVKKQFGQTAKERYKNGLIIPEFVRMSRKPGIGKLFYDKNKEIIYKYDEINYINYKGKLHTTKPPKYFDRLFKEEDEAFITLLKDKRRIKARNNEKIKLMHTSLNDDDYEKLEERTKIEQIGRLKRFL